MALFLLPLATLYLLSGTTNVGTVIVDYTGLSDRAIPGWGRGGRDWSGLPCFA